MVRKLIVIGAVGLFVGGFMTGCGDDGSQSTPASPSPVVIGSPSETETANRGPEAVGSIPVPEIAATGEPVEIDLLSYFSDPDGDELVYAATSSDSETVTVAVSGSILTMTAVASGSAEVTVSATDPGGLTATQMLRYSTTWDVLEPTTTEPPENRAPEAVGTIPVQALTAGGGAGSVDVEQYFSDPDGDALTYTAASSNTGILTASVTGSVVILSPMAAGSVEVTVVASDSVLSAMQQFDVTVKAAGPPHPPIQAFSNCAAMHDAGWNLGVNQNGGTYRSEWDDAEKQTYSLNTARDRDRDGHACESGGSTTFDAGAWRIGTDIQAGRYFVSTPQICRWSRRDASGTILNSFGYEEIVFPSDVQEIADAKDSDHAFHTTCNSWQSTPTASLPTNRIISGRWLVGEQLATGVYTTHADEGCYWSTLSGFSGTLDDIIDNEYVDFVDSVLSPGQRVRITSGIVGFGTNDDCGIWTRVGSASGAAEAGDRSETERNYREHIQSGR